MTSIATLQVDLIAHTQVDDVALEQLAGHGYTVDIFREHDAEALAEFAGRSCYQSWTRPNPETATAAGYMANIIDHQHFSVLEHGSVSFYIQGVSRSLTHELVRHRHFSFSQLSQRYVDEADAKYVVPPALRGNEKWATYYENFWSEVLDVYGTAVRDLMAQGLSRKEARQTARSVLPNMTETKLVVSGNHRSWREFLIKRGSAAADTEIRELAVAVYDLLNAIAPAIYQDIEPFSINGKDGYIGLVQA